MAIPVQLVKNCEQIDDYHATIAGDKNRHKIQLNFEYDPLLFKKGDAILIKRGVVSQNAKVLNITVERDKDVELLTTPILPGMALADLLWPMPIKAEQSANITKQRDNGVSGGAAIEPNSGKAVKKTESKASFKL